MNSYTDFKLEELLVCVHSHDDAAFSELLGRYTPLITGVARGFVSSVFSYDEAFADACVAFHKAAMSFDLKKEGITFGLYARICIYRRLYDTVEKLARHNQFIGDDIDVDNLSDGKNIESRIVGRERMQEYLQKARSVLSDYEYRVFLLYIEGDSTAVIAEKLEQTSKSVDNAKARMFKSLRKFSDLFSDI